ncbi:hypothetical protein GCM10010116_40990 [Microbispora rosea subsp. aerata]|nr:hypothetical protein [Microbispora rosea]GGO20453.1 hypothetical protein GCM10010116_40990 [Microbispora rosea subsp. aerata]GIH57165.1 hypothetical protein Mro02_40790 [Microbispora rosea subsp. aerata]GLJ84765.1 hypothetical protein GCM10017588_34930 [Microbispora rosea subsp. aerata]
MTSGRTTVTIYLVVFVGLILVGLILFAPRPLWLGALVLVTLGAICFAIAKMTGRNAEPPVTYAPPPVEPVVRREHRITEVALPSAWDDYDFVFSATIRWSPTGVGTGESFVNAEALAVEAVLARARRITETRPPNRASLVQHELGGALGRMEPDETGCLRVMAESVTLTLSEDDRERLAKLASTRKENAVWEHEMRYQQSRRTYLSENVLKDPGSAVVWWLAKNDDHVEKTVKDIGLLAQLSSAANNTHVPEPFLHLVPGPVSGERVAEPEPYLATGEASPYASVPRTPADHFDAFLLSLDLPERDPGRALLSRQISDVLRRHGRQDVADELSRRFDVPTASLFDDFDPPPAPPDGEPDR